MAVNFNPAVSNYFSGASATGGAVTFPSGTHEGVVDPATAADIRQVLYGILEKFTDAYSALAADAKSENLTINRSASIPNDNTVRKSFTISFNLDLPALSVDTTES